MMSIWRFAYDIYIYVYIYICVCIYDVFEMFSNVHGTWRLNTC